jgi:ubiquinone biosynthesis protein COQ9
MIDTMNETRDKILSHAIPCIAHHGFSRATIVQAAKTANLELPTALVAFPRGGVDLGLHFLERAEKSALISFSDRPARSKIRDNITIITHTWLDEIFQTPRIAQKCMALLMTPFYCHETIALLWKTADDIWCTCGDKSTDYNWYTKRSLLVAVLLHSIIYGLADKSSDSMKIKIFASDCIQKCANITQIKNRLQEITIQSNILPDTLTSMIASIIDFILPRIQPPAKLNNIVTNGVRGVAGLSPL